MRFLLDENMRFEVWGFLKSQNHDVIFVPKGLKNGQVLALAQRESRILITFDKDFENDLLYNPAQYSGIVRLRIHPPELAKIKLALGNLLKTIDAEDFAKKLFLLEETGFRIRPAK